MSDFKTYKNSIAYCFLLVLEIAQAFDLNVFKAHTFLQKSGTSWPLATQISFIYFYLI